MPEGKRKLAALMQTDIRGYTKMVERDEALAMELLEEHNNLIRSWVSNHSGHEIKFMGDAFLVMFPSALQAAREGLGFAMGRRPYMDLDSYRTQLLQPLELVAPTGCGYYIDVPQRTEHLAKIKIFKNWLMRVSRSESPSAAITQVDAQPL